MIDLIFECVMSDGDQVEFVSRHGLVDIEIYGELPAVSLNSKQMIELRDALNEAYPDEDAYYEAKNWREKNDD